MKGYFLIFNVIGWGVVGAEVGFSEENGPRSESVSWLREHGIPFDTPEAGHGFQDLEPLREIIGDAQIVALGEGTHGTHEFFRMKHRLIEFLVREIAS